jgi:hypothetical protein
MRLANPNIGATSVMFVVMKKRAELLALLTKNGVKYPANATDMQLAMIVTNLLKISKSFRMEFEKLLTEQDVIVGIFSGMDGAYSNFTFETTTFDIDENDAVNALTTIINNNDVIRIET